MIINLSAIQIFYVVITFVQLATTCTIIMSSTAFSSDGVEVIARHVASTFPLAHSPSRKSEDNLRRYYEIERCIDFIRSEPLFQRVASKYASIACM